MVNSPPTFECVEIGLAMPFPRGDISTPLMEADLEVGGLPKPDDTGDRTGEGDLLSPEDNEFSPAT